MRKIDVCLNGFQFSMPAITLGTVWFGSKISAHTATEILNAYVDLGGNWIDTARVYGPQLFPERTKMPDDLDSEEVIGRWMEARNNRQDLTIITKGGFPDVPSGKARLSEECISGDLESSLDKLRTKYADIYFVHKDDESIPVEEIMPALHKLAVSGKVKALGASNWRAARIKEANSYAAAHGLTPFSISQVRWSLALPFTHSRENEFDLELDRREYAEYVDLGMPVMAYSSQARGFFIKTSKCGFAPDKLGRAAEYLNAENIKRAEAVHRLAKAKGISPAAAAFSYLWAQPFPVTAVATGNTSDSIIESCTDCDFYSDNIDELDAYIRR